MAKKLCKNCKYWTRNTKQYDNLHFGNCSSEKFVYIGGISPNETELSNDSLNYWDVESYRAGFETGENFGCIHFESKVKENG